MTELFRQSAVELSGLLRSGEVSAVEVATAHLDRIAEVDGAIHAFLHVDQADTLAAAKAVDDARIQLRRAAIRQRRAQDPPRRLER